MSPRTTSSYRATNGSRVDSATHSRFRPAYLEDNPHRRHSRIQSNASHEARKDSATDYKDLFDTLQLDRQFHKEFFVTLRKFRGLPKIRHLLVSSDPKAKKEICREFLKSVGSEYWTGEPRQKLEERGQSDKFKKQRTNHEYEDNHAYDETGEGSEGDAMDIEFTEETEPPGRRLHLRHTRRRLWDDQQVDKDSRAKYRSIWKTISSREVAAENCRDGEASSSDPSDSSDSYDTDDSYDDRKLKNAEDRRRSKRPPTLQNLQDASTAARPQEDDQDLFRSAALGLRYRKTRFTNPRGIPRSNGSNDANLSKDRKKESARKGEDKARLQVAESHSEQARNANQDRARLKNLLSGAFSLLHQETGNH